MNTLKIAFRDDRRAFAPGEEILGLAGWQLDDATRSVELRLFWFTRGKGTRDAGVVETVAFDQPLPAEARPFRFRLPTAPYSFSGRLISLVWALELVAQPSLAVVREEIVVAPGGREVLLESVPEEPATKPWFLRRRGALPQP